MNDVQAANLTVDVLIVGSGPLGATFARLISEQAPAAKILMVEVGPQLTPRPGVHIKNIADPEERAQAQLRSQGPAQYQYQIPTIADRAAAATASQATSHLQRAGFLARPGTYLVDENATAANMPAAALSSNVGGMGAHWTCACPLPGNTERISFIPDDEWDRLCAKAKELLCVTQAAYPESVEAFAIQQTLSEVFDTLLPAARKVQRMPLAAQVQEDGRLYWTGPDVILGPLAETANDGSGHFALRAETICRRLITEGDRVTGAVIEHLPSGQRETVAATVVAVAADALRTPQLLWASGIRPPALGHYLNDQPQIMAAVELKEEVIERARATLEAAGKLKDAQRLAQETTVGVFWIPFHAPGHPFHGQIMHIDASPIPLAVDETRTDPKHVVGLGWFSTKELRYADYIEFSAEETDSFGMPQMTIHYQLTPKDEAALAAARKEQARAAAAFGKPLKDDESRVVPPGSSLHYQGSVRMGERDDSTSVCDPYSRVWGWPNLFLGSNGVIPTATASNPTFTSVALAVRAAEKIVALLAAAGD